MPKEPIPAAFDFEAIRAAMREAAPPPAPAGPDPEAMERLAREMLRHVKGLEARARIDVSLASARLGDAAREMMAKGWEIRRLTEEGGGGGSARQGGHGGAAGGGGSAPGGGGGVGWIGGVDLCVPPKREPIGVIPPGVRVLTMERRAGGWCRVVEVEVPEMPPAPRLETACERAARLHGKMARDFVDIRCDRRVLVGDPAWVVWELRARVPDEARTMLSQFAMSVSVPVRELNVRMVRNSFSPEPEGPAE
jgi:hypothetical protein